MKRDKFKLVFLSVCILSSMFLLIPNDILAIPWGFSEHLISTDVPHFDGTRWRYGYQVASNPDETANINKFEIQIDPAIDPSLAVQDAVVPSGWTVDVTPGLIRFETASNPIVPGDLQQFEYFSPFNPGNSSGTLFTNPAVWFADALAPNIGFFDGRPLNAWIGLGGLGAWTSRQVKLNQLIDTPNHKRIDSNWRGEYSLAQFPIGTRAAVEYHYSGEGQPGGPLGFVYDYFSENLSTRANNNRGFQSPYDLFNHFGLDAEYFISWTRYVGPPNGWPGVSWDNPDWPDFVFGPGNIIDFNALGPKDIAGNVGQIAVGPFNSPNRPIWATKNAGVNPDFSPSSPFNYNVTAVPEPSSVFLTSLGIMVIYFNRKGSKKKKEQLVSLSGKSLA